VSTGGSVNIPIKGHKMFKLCVARYIDENNDNILQVVTNRETSVVLELEDVIPVSLALSRY
jgi:hypothetical protein